MPILTPRRAAQSMRNPPAERHVQRNVEHPTCGAKRVSPEIIRSPRARTEQTRIRNAGISPALPPFRVRASTRITTPPTSSIRRTRRRSSRARRLPRAARARPRRARGCPRSRAPCARGCRARRGSRRGARAAPPRRRVRPPSRKTMDCVATLGARAGCACAGCECRYAATPAVASAPRRTSEMGRRICVMSGVPLGVGAELWRRRRSSGLRASAASAARQSCSLSRYNLKELVPLFFPHH